MHLHAQMMSFRKRGPQMRLFMEGLESKDRLNIFTKPVLLAGAVKGNYALRDVCTTPIDMRLQRGGMKSAFFDSAPKQVYEMTISCCRLPKNSRCIESDPVCIVERRAEGEFDAGQLHVFKRERVMSMGPTFAWHHSCRPARFSSPPSSRTLHWTATKALPPRMTPWRSFSRSPSLAQCRF